MHGMTTERGCTCVGEVHAHCPPNSSPGSTDWHLRSSQEIWVREANMQAMESPRRPVQLKNGKTCAN
jgi:hypothetical protein